MSVPPDPFAAIPRYLDGSRREVLEWFAKNSRSLGELYEAALRLLDDSRFPGRGYLISHAVREIGNRLPHIVATLPRESVLRYSERVEELNGLWAGVGFPLDGSDPLAGKALGPDLTPVISPVLNGMSGLIGDHRDVYRKRRQKAAALFEALSGEVSEPVINQWLQVTGWFSGKAHHPKDADPPFDFGKLSEQFALFEATLTALVRPPIPTARKLNEILEKTNA